MSKSKETLYSISRDYAVSLKGLLPKPSLPEDYRSKLKEKLSNLPQFFAAATLIAMIPIIIFNVALGLDSYLNKTQNPSIFGLTPLVVTSGSMATKNGQGIQPGDLILANQLNDSEKQNLKKGDVITFENADNNLVTHRIVQTNGSGKNMTFTTKGDANNVQDRDSVSLKKIIGKQSVQIPKLGSFIVWSKTPIGLLILIGTPLALLYLSDYIANRRNRKNFGKNKEFSDSEYQEVTPITADLALAEVSETKRQTSNNKKSNNKKSKKVNLNTVNLAKLQTLTGIGEAKAQKIIEYRNENGLFNSIDDLQKVSGFGIKMVDKIRNEVTV